jgi:hypothetical protein
MMPTTRKNGSNHGAFCALSLPSLVSASVLAFSPIARADVGGVPFWLSGQFASLAAVPAAPGWLLVTSPY